MTSSPLSESSDPVGSSAKSTSGFATRPRANATRLGLAARHLPGAVAFHTLEVEPFEPAPRFPKGLCTARATEQQRQRDVLLGRQLRHELAELEHEAEAITPQPRALRLPHGVESTAVEVDFAGIRDEDARQAVEQRRLARAARSHHGEDLAPLHRNARAAEGWGFAEAEHKVAPLRGIVPPATTTEDPLAGFMPSPLPPAPRAGRR